MKYANEPLLFAPSESRELAEAVARTADIALAALEERSFDQGEFKLRPQVSVRNRTVVVLQSLAGSSGAPTAQRFVRLLFLLSGLRDAGATHLEAIVPYLAYARKDRRTQPRDPIYTRYVAQLLETTGLQRLIALDVHNSAALDNAFRLHVDHLSALPMFVRHFVSRRIGTDWAVASPDVGGIKRVQLFREQLQRELGHPAGLVFIEKRRVGGELSGGTVIGEVAGRAVVVLDDLCNSGNTLRRAAASLRSAGATAVYVAVTHAPQEEGLAALLADTAIDQIVVTDSVGAATHPALNSADPRLVVLPVAPLLGQALLRPLRGLPIAPLLDHWPPPEQ
jgi:ribose-phosphate pyrophosphokinase